MRTKRTALRAAALLCAVVVLASWVHEPRSADPAAVVIR
jgi:hypothetical protein